MDRSEVRCKVDGFSDLLRAMSMSCEAEQAAVDRAQEDLGAAQDKCVGVDPQSAEGASCYAAVMGARARLASAQAQLVECRTAVRVLEAEGFVTFLRVHETFSGFGGGSTNVLDVEAVFKLDSDMQRAFGFQLRDDEFLPARHGMLDILRDAMANQLKVLVDFLESVNPPNQNCRAVRIAVLKPAPSRPWPGQVTPF
jgi:hypothetical protein